MLKPRRIKVVKCGDFGEFDLKLNEAAYEGWSQSKPVVIGGKFFQLHIWLGGSAPSYYSLWLAAEDGNNWHYRPYTAGTTSRDELFAPQVRILWDAVCAQNPGLREKWTFNA